MAEQGLLAAVKSETLIQEKEHTSGLKIPLKSSTSNFRLYVEFQVEPITFDPPSNLKQ